MRNCLVRFLVPVSLLACSQNYSEKPVDEALQEKGFTPLPTSTGVGGDPPVTSGERWGNLLVRVPEGWRDRTPSSSMRIAEYVLPAPEGSAAGDAELAVFAGIGGSTEENVNRWYGQFEQPDGTPTAEVARRWEVSGGSGISATIVDISGTFKGGMGPSAGRIIPGFRMLAAVVQAGSTVYHLKLTGSRAALDLWAGAFEQLVSNLELAG